MSMDVGRITFGPPGNTLGASWTVNLDTKQLSLSIAQLRRLYLHANNGGVVSAGDISRVIQSLERFTNGTR